MLWTRGSPTKRRKWHKNAQKYKARGNAGALLLYCSTRLYTVARALLSARASSIKAVFQWCVFFTYVYARVLNTHQWTNLRVVSTPYVYVRKKNASRLQMNGTMSLAQICNFGQSPVDTPTFIICTIFRLFKLYLLRHNNKTGQKDT